MFKYVARGPSAAYIEGVVFDTVNGQTYGERNALFDPWCQDSPAGSASLLIRTVEDGAPVVDGEVPIQFIPARAITDIVIDSSDADLQEYIDNTWEDDAIQIGDIVKVGGSVYMLYQNNGDDVADYLDMTAGGGGGSLAWADITGKPSTFPPSSHTHAQSEVTGLVSALSAKADASALTSGLAGKENVGVAATLIANLVNSAPAQLDTLKELSDALGADANFASTITTALSLKAADSAFQATKAIVDAATAAATINVLVKRDGSGGATFVTVTTQYLGNSGHMQMDFTNDTIYDNAGQFSLRPVDRTLNDTGSLVSVNYSARTLVDDDGSTLALAWQDRKLYNNTGVETVDWQGKSLSHAGFATVDWAGAALIDTSGQNLSMNWNSRIAYSSDSAASVDWEGRHLQRSGGGTLAMDWGNSTLNDSAEVTALDWASRQLDDIAGIPTLDWQGQQLISSAHVTLNWANRQAYDSNDDTTLDWASCRLMVDSQDSVHWGNRTLTADDGTIAASWVKGFKSRFGDTASRPALGVNDKGVMYYDTDELKQFWWNGTAWADTAGVAAAGGTGEIQFNNGGGTFGASAAIAYDSGSLKVTQSGDTTIGTPASYGIRLRQGGDDAITLGADASENFIQSWNNKPLTINPLGTDTFVSGFLKVVGDLEVQGGTLSGGDLNWDLNSLLLQADGSDSINFNSRRLFSNNGSLSVNWNVRQLSDGVVGNSIDYGARTLIGADGTTVIASWGANLLIADGTVSDPAIAFASDGDADTGWYWLSDGAQAWACNGTQLMRLEYSVGLTVTGDITATGAIKVTGSNNKFAHFDNTGAIDTQTLYGTDPNVFDGMRWDTTIVPTNADNGNSHHYKSVNINPTVADARQGWNIDWLDINLGQDNSGNKIGDPVDVKGALILQDLTFIGKRYGADNNVISMAYTTGGTAGAEVVSHMNDFEYSVQIEDGVSTTQQVYNALQAYNQFTGTVIATITGSASNPQVAVAQTFFTGGVNAYGTIQGSVVAINNRWSSNTGNIIGKAAYIDFGNGTDEVHGRNVSAYTGNIVVHDNADLQVVSIFDFAVGVGETNSAMKEDFNAFNLYGRVAKLDKGFKGFTMGFNFGDIDFANVYQSALAIENVQQTINVFADFNNISGVVGNQYYGIAIQPNIEEVTGGFYGINISPNVDLAYGNSVGLSVNMGNVDVYPGVQATLVVQDLTLTSIQTGTFSNSLTIEYVDDGTAGAETVNINGMNIVVHMEDGVSTATQIRTALLANLSVAGNLTVTITGTGSNTQTAFGPTNLAGGVNAGTKRAANFDGDVNINGALAFSGALSVGGLSAYTSAPLVNGGGAPGSAHTLISAPTVANNVTVANADFLGVNTAALITLGDNSTTTTAFLGVCALGLPAVLSMGTGATIDKVVGAVFALSLDAGATGGTADKVLLCNAIAIPNGATTVNNLYGYHMELPFGAVGTDAWGLYIDPAIDNYMAGTLKIGDGADQTNGCAVLDLESTAKGFLPPRMTTTQRDAIATPVDGLMIYNTTDSKFQGYSGAVWTDLN